MVPLPPDPPKHPSQSLTTSQVFIHGSNFQEAALVARSLRSFYGIGPLTCRNLMARFHIHNTAKIGDLGERQVNSLAAELGSMTLENDLRRQLVDNIKRLRDMGTYRGRRHAMSLPVRGQRTRTQVSLVRVMLAWKPCDCPRILYDEWDCGGAHGDQRMMLIHTRQISTARKFNRVERRG